LYLLIYCLPFVNMYLSLSVDKANFLGLRGSNLRRFIIPLKNGRDLCAHRAGGASTYRFVCAYTKTRKAPATKVSLSSHLISRVKLFYTGSVVNAEMLVMMLEKHGIAAAQSFVDASAPDAGDLSRPAPTNFSTPSARMSFDSCETFLLRQITRKPILVDSFFGNADSLQHLADAFHHRFRT
jgi:hypothetical protein